ncbi:MAG: DUF6438 domain-containing protein [Chloroflexota bacterium]|nr:DUF6438 domain-containing protein [Chloroflexota bacterium]
MSRSLARIIFSIVCVALIYGCNASDKPDPTPRPVDGTSQYPTGEPQLLPATDIQKALARLEARSSLSYEEILSLASYIEAKAPNPQDFTTGEEYIEAKKKWEQGEREQFYRKLKECRLKESHAWVYSVSESPDEHGNYVTWFFMYDPYLDYRQVITTAFHPASDPDIGIRGLNAEQVEELELGEKVLIEGKINTASYDQSYTDLVDGKITEAGEAEAVPNLKGKYTEEQIEESVITMGRTGCFGTCPAYHLTIEGDGTVNFIGQGYTRITGRVETHVERETVERLIAEFEKVGFNNLDDTYPADATDSAGVRISIEIAGKTKRIEHDLSSMRAPRRLVMLEERIDRIIDTEQWIH